MGIPITNSQKDIYTQKFSIKKYELLRVNICLSVCYRDPIQTLKFFLPSEPGLPVIFTLQNNWGLGTRHLYTSYMVS